MFSPEGRIEKPNSPRPAQPAEAPYGTANTPSVQVGNLKTRNQQYFNLGQPNGAVAGTEVPLACHHVVGWDVIWGFWNAMIDKKEYLVARSYLALFGAPQATTSKLENLIKTKKFADGGNWLQMMCWKPNNIVRGPRERSDDPNSNSTLETKIDFQKARSDIYEKRVSGLVGAGRQMCHYISTGNVEHAKKAIAYFKSIQNEKIMEWDESIWAVDSDHPGYDQDLVKHTIVQPKWRIHISKG